MITISHVTKRFGRAVAVDDASLTLAPGESLALWGANGAGKTTLLRCVLGLLRFRGSITVGPHDVRREGKAARVLVGYVPQELGFYDDLGVGEAIGFFGALKGLRRAPADESLERVGLRGHDRKRIRELSGGMKQRLALAIALLGDPPVLVLDEVTASLDAVGREEFVGLLDRLGGAGRTMLFASHRIEEVATLARRVALLDRGRIARVEPCEDFVRSLARESVLHLKLPVAQHERALRSLREAGFLAERNGTGLLVPVTPDRKAAPLHALAGADVRVDDFEVVSIERAAALASHGAHASSKSQSGAGPEEVAS
jgi:ABC-type multidrug transport system ATPase subunit